MNEQWDRIEKKLDKLEKKLDRHIKEIWQVYEPIKKILEKVKTSFNFLPRRPTQITINQWTVSVQTRKKKRDEIVK